MRKKTAEVKTVNKLIVFKGKQIRRTLYNNEWWFVIEDIILALTDSNDQKQYIQRMKQRDEELSKGWVQLVHTLLIQTKGGKQRMNCATTEGIFRIIQSVTSPKAEPFKRWLARVDMNVLRKLKTLNWPLNVQGHYINQKVIQMLG